MFAEGEKANSAAGLSEQDVDEMVQRLAHAIRNPLAAVKSGVQLIHRLTAPEGRVGGYFDSVLRQIERTDGILGDMQRWAKLSAGVAGRVAVRAAVEYAAAVQRTAASRTGVALQVAGGGDTDVLIDPSNLQIALGELLSNAIHYTQPGSNVVLSWLVKPEGWVRINVDDEGPGIPAEDASRICKPFFSTSTQGSGLGLAIAVRICRQAGGHLEWLNLPGEGCRFSLVLPEG